jgi:hypothetical protein
MNRGKERVAPCLERKEKMAFAMPISSLTLRLSRQMQWCWGSRYSRKRCHGAREADIMDNKVAM